MRTVLGQRDGRAVLREGWVVVAPHEQRDHLQHVRDQPHDPVPRLAAGRVFVVPDDSSREREREPPLGGLEARGRPTAAIRRPRVARGGRGEDQPEVRLRQRRPPATPLRFASTRRPRSNGLRRARRERRWAPGTSGDAVLRCRLRDHQLLGVCWSSSVYVSLLVRVAELL